MTVPTGAPWAQNPGSTTKNGNEAGWQPGAFIHPGLVFCPVCLLGLPFEVLSAEGCQPGCLREAGVAQPGEVVCVVDGCSVPRGRRAPGNPDAVRAGLGGDISRSSFPSWVQIRMSFSSCGHPHACPCLSSPGHSRALLCHPPPFCLCYHDHNLRKTPQEQRHFWPHGNSPSPDTIGASRVSLVTPWAPTGALVRGKLLTPATRHPPATPLPLGRPSQVDALSPLSWSWLPPSGGDRNRRLSHSADWQRLHAPTATLWSSLAFALLGCAREPRRSCPLMDPRSPSKPHVVLKHLPSACLASQQGETALDPAAPPSFEVLRARGPPMVRILPSSRRDVQHIWRPRPMSLPRPYLRQVDVRVPSLEPSCSVPTVPELTRPRVSSLLWPRVPLASCAPRPRQLVNFCPPSVVV